MSVGVDPNVGTGRFTSRWREPRRTVRAILRRHGPRLGLAGFIAWVLIQTAYDHRYEWFEKRVVVVEPGHLIRGAWQRPKVMERVIEREKIRTIVTLAALDDNADRFADQVRVVRRTGVNWIILPISGSRPSLDQMSEAADLLADRSLWPIFFHCVAGHHRTSLAHAAYRIRHEGWTREQAWEELEALPWTRGTDDVNDRDLIRRFAAREAARRRK